MLAAVLKGVRQLSLEEAPKPALINDSDVIVKVTATTICTSDVHFWEGYLPPSAPFIIGHEFVGIIEDAGSAVKLFKPGDRVAVSTCPFCGVCENCRKGIHQWCMNSGLLGGPEVTNGIDGGMAEFARIPHADSALIKIPDEVSDEQAVMVPDMLATGYDGVVRCNLQKGDTVAIFGAGPVGLSSVITARLYSPSKIILVDVLFNRLQIGLEMGATHIINAAEQDPVAQIMELTNGQGVTASIEAVGDAQCVATAVQVTGLGGIISVIGVFPLGNIDFPMQTALMKLLTIKPGLTHMGYTWTLMEMLAEGKLDTRPLATHIMPLTEFDRAFAIFAEKKDNVLKVVLKP